MELRHLRYPIMVAEELYFTHAAELLHIEASPLSHAIKGLEYDLGAQLHHPIRITAASVRPASLPSQASKTSFERGRVFRRQCISTLLPPGQCILQGTARWDIG